MWHLCGAGCFSYGTLPWTPPLKGTSLHRRYLSVERLGDLEPVYDLSLPEALTKTCMWRLCETVRFSYGESPWTRLPEETGSAAVLSTRPLVF